MSSALDTAPDPFSTIVASLNRQYQTVGDLVYEIIREAILKGVFSPGEHLRQDELATKIGVSRMPVRSALLRLESEGLVNFHPHRGAVVRRLSVDEVVEIYELRITLETRALTKSTHRLTPERLDYLTGIVGDMNSTNDSDEFLRLHVIFYRELYDAARQPLLVNLIERLRDEVGRYWVRRRREVSSARTGEGGHETILAYLKQGNDAAAVQALENHLAALRDELVETIQAAEDAAK